MCFKNIFGRFLFVLLQRTDDERSRAPKRPISNWELVIEYICLLQNNILGHIRRDFREDENLAITAQHTFCTTHVSCKYQKDSI